jgi:transposase InsO family protein
LRNAGSRYFCESLFWASQPKQAAGSCYDNAVVERFFGSLKHDWIFKVYQPTREFMKQEVASYMKYYNLVRLHTANGNMSPTNFENSQINVSSFS